MSELSALNQGIRKARHKAARVVLGLETAERRVKHHRKQRDHFRAEGHPRKADRAARYLHRWQKRQGWLRDKHIFLQLVLDKRQRRKHKWLKEHPQDQYPSTGVVEFDGHQVAAWIVHDILAPARASGYWHGYVISGWRDPAYSESLCLNMCGRPSCSGTCAGRSSRHSQSVKPDGAVDLTDPAGAVRYARDHGIEFHGAGEVLPYDTPHCSTWGN